MIVPFLNDLLREINEEKTTKKNFDLIKLTFEEFIELSNKIEVKFGVQIECVDMFSCVGVVELAKRIETLMMIKELNEDREWIKT